MTEPSIEPELANHEELKQIIMASPVAAFRCSSYSSLDAYVEYEQSGIIRKCRTNYNTDPRSVLVESRGEWERPTDVYTMAAFKQAHTNDMRAENDSGDPLTTVQLTYQDCQLILRALGTAAPAELLNTVRKASEAVRGYAEAATKDAARRAEISSLLEEIESKRRRVDELENEVRLES